MRRAVLVLLAVAAVLVVAAGAVVERGPADMAVGVLRTSFITPLRNVCRDARQTILR